MDDLPVVDLRREEVRKALGIETAQLIGTRATTQALAARALDLGAHGMVVPSAAQRGAWNLVVFPPGLPRLRIIGSKAVTPGPPPA